MDLWIVVNHNFKKEKHVCSEQISTSGQNNLQKNKKYLKDWTLLNRDWRVCNQWNTKALYQVCYSKYSKVIVVLINLEINILIHYISSHPFGGYFFITSPADNLTYNTPIILINKYFMFHATHECLDKLMHNLIYKNSFI